MPTPSMRRPSAIPDRGSQHANIYAVALPVVSAMNALARRQQISDANGHGVLRSIVEAAIYLRSMGLRVKIALPATQGFVLMSPSDFHAQLKSPLKAVGTHH